MTDGAPEMTIADKLNAEKALIFRIVHRDNVAWILEHGLHARNGLVCPTYRNIGNADLIGKRATRTVPVAPGGTLNNYVPFYFTPYSIMLYNIHTGYGVARVPNEDIVILVASLRDLARKGFKYVFTNQHAYPVMAEYYNDLARLDRVDWPLLQSRRFKHDPDDPAKKERYQAEALIWQHVPVDALLGMCCYTKAVGLQLQAELKSRSLTLRTLVQTGWYF